MSKLENMIAIDSRDASIALQDLEDLVSSDTDSLPKLMEAKGLSKAQAIASLGQRALYWDAKAEALKAFFKPYLDAYQEELDFCEARAERARAGVALMVPLGSEHVDDSIAVTWRTSEKGEVLDPELIPIDFTRVKTEPALDLLKAAAKQGKETPGYRLTKNYHLQIKPGGLRAKANAKARAKNKEIEA
jgi:hypothetical protein